MKTLDYEDKFHIQGRGDVYTLKIPLEASRSMQGIFDTFGRIVLIDGAEYEIKGYEARSHGQSTFRKDEPIGLLVRRVNKEK